MTATVTKAGPYFSSGLISFSSLRDTFRGTSGSIKASELIRNTTTSNTNPIVPDATENSSVSTSNNLKLSQFRNTIKYYYITQTGTDFNFDISAQSWNSNLNKNIKKWAYINGTCGSTSVLSSAATIGSTVYNLTIDVSGGIYGAGGSSGISPTINGGNGGDALSITNSSGSNLVINVQSTANIYAGGGGGEKGIDGIDGTGGSYLEDKSYVYCEEGLTAGCAYGGTYYGYARIRCCSGSDSACSKSLWINYCYNTIYTAGGTKGIGGDGGLGQGYNQTRTNGTAGAAGGAGGGSGATDGTAGENGGNGGDWATSGGNTNNSGNGGSSGKAIAGSGYSVSGTINSSTIKGLYQ